MNASVIGSVYDLTAYSAEYSDFRKRGKSSSARKAQKKASAVTNQYRSNASLHMMLKKQEFLLMAIADAQAELQNLKGDISDNEPTSKQLEALLVCYRKLAVLHEQMAKSISGKKDSKEMRKLFVKWSKTANWYQQLFARVNEHSTKPLSLIEHEVEYESVSGYEDFTVYVENQAIQLAYYEEVIAQLQREVSRAQTPAEYGQLQKELALHYGAMAEIYELSFYPGDLYKAQRCFRLAAQARQDAANPENGDQTLRRMRSATDSPVRTAAVKQTKLRRHQSVPAYSLVNRRRMHASADQEKTFYVLHINRLQGEIGRCEEQLKQASLSLMDQVLLYRQLAVCADALANRFESIQKNKEATQARKQSDAALGQMAEAEVKLYWELDTYNERVGNHALHVEGLIEEESDAEVISTAQEEASSDLASRLRRIFGNHDVSVYQPIMQAKPHDIYLRLFNTDKTKIRGALLEMHRSFRVWFNPQRFVAAAIALTNELKRGGVEQIKENIDELFRDPAMRSLFLKVWATMHKQNSGAIKLFKDCCDAEDKFSQSCILPTDSKIKHDAAIKGMSNVISRVYALADHLPETVPEYLPLYKLKKNLSKSRTQSWQSTRYYKRAIDDMADSEKSSSLSKHSNLEMAEVVVKQFEVQATQVARPSMTM